VKNEAGFIFVKWVRHWRTGKIIRPVKAKALKLRIKRKK